MNAYLQAETKARWTASQKAWCVADSRHYRELFHLEPIIVGKEVLSKIHSVNLQAFKRFQEQIKLKGYSENTLRTYSLEFAQLNHMNPLSIL